MAKVRMAPEVQNPPAEAVEPSEERDIQAEQAAKAKELEHQQKVRADQQAKDNAAILRDREAAKEAELKIQQQEREQRARVMAAPLSTAEQNELQTLEKQAMKPGNREPLTMIRLSDLRTRARLGHQPE